VLLTALQVCGDIQPGDQRLDQNGRRPRNAPLHAGNYAEAERAYLEK